MDHLWAPWRMEYILESQEPNPVCIFCSFPAENSDPKNLIAYRSEHCFVMLNKFPYNNGHLMIIPFKHEADLTRLADDIIIDLHHTLSKSIRVLQQVFNPHGWNIGINLGRTAGAGIEDHLHYHLVPRWNGDTNFMPVLADTKVLSEALAKTWEKLNRAFINLPDFSK
jgi:ATP adenylyltransferase